MNEIAAAEITTMVDPQLNDLQKVIFTRKQIATRVSELGAEISRDYQGKDLVLVGIMKGGIIFLSDLSRCIAMPHQFDLVGAQSYKGGTQPTLEVSVTKDLDLPVEGRDVLLIEDIYDTGNTLRTIHRMIQMYRPRTLKICALLFKNKDRDHELDIQYIGFDIEDAFVVGYGLDYKERYRNLSCIGVLRPEIYQ